MKGKLTLIPCGLGQSNPSDHIPNSVLTQVSQTRHFVVENERSARRFLRSIIPDFPIDESNFVVLDKHGVNDYSTLLKPCLDGHDLSLISEAGCPAIADPGEELVRKAHELGITVNPFVGPSSILLTLMASGLNGENFAFNAYLPIEKKARLERIRVLIQKILKENQSQLFMDTPFRNDQLLEDVLNNSPDHLMLCIASDLTLGSQKINTRSIMDWKKKKPPLHKTLVMFALGQ